MDVQSLYPNIDHKEGIDACKTVLDKRNNRAFPTNRLTKLIQLIPDSNIMMLFPPSKGDSNGYSNGSELC